MSELADATFQCGDCGKRFAWKPKLAGKKAKCGCGSIIYVPTTIAVPEKVLAGSGDEPAFEDLYAMAATAPVAAPRPRPVNPVKTADAKTPEPLRYRSARGTADHAADSRDGGLFPERTRDLFVPAGMLLAGFAALVAWAIVALETDFVASGMVTGFFLLSTLVKTAALIALAFVFAPMIGVSFGTVVPAVLKFAAVILFVDVGLIWFYEGAGSTGGRMGIRVLGLSLMLAGLVTAFWCMYLFEMDWEETRMFSTPFTVVSWILGLVINFGTTRVLSAF